MRGRLLAPRIDATCEGVVRRGRGPSWRVRWRLRNAGPRALTVLEAWHPHGRFRSSRLARSLRVAPRSSATLDVPARSDVRAGEVVENCFLILRVDARGARWRVLVRSTVVGDAAGVPRPRVQAVDVHHAER